MPLCMYCHSTNVSEVVEEKKATKSSHRSSGANTGWVTSSGIQGAASGETEITVEHLSLPEVYAPLMTSQGMPVHHMILFYSDAGVGKSSVAMRLCDDLLAVNPSVRILYVSSDEHVTKLRRKAQRFCRAASTFSRPI